MDETLFGYNARTGEWFLQVDYTYVHPHFGAITVPAGTPTDFDSVPRLPVIYMMAKNRAVLAPVVHDYLYKTGKINGRSVSRATADRIFLDAMAHEGVSWRHRRTIWLGVRAGGFGIWRRHRAND